MADTEEVSLRPIALRPGGASGNPFAMFGKGAGFTMKAKKVRLPPASRSLAPDSWIVQGANTLQCFSQASTPAGATDGPIERKDGERIKYDKDFLMKFMEVRARTDVAGRLLLPPSRAAASKPAYESMRSFTTYALAYVPCCIRQTNQTFLICSLQRYMKCPEVLQNSQLEIVLTEDQERDAARQTLQVLLLPAFA